MAINKKKTMVCVALIIITTVLFLCTVAMRKPWFGIFSGENHDWLTGSTVTFSSNWYNEGAWNLKFGLYENPSSPEFPTLISRLPYLSYPPGSVIPVFLIAKLLNNEPGPSMVMAYNLANHFFIAVFLSLTIFFFLIKLEIRSATAFSFALVPILLELFLPAPLYFHQNSFFSDQAVILPYVLIIFLEVVRGNCQGRRRRNFDILQGLVFFYGVFTDWFFVFIVLAVYLKRLATGEIPLRPRKLFFKKSLAFATVPVSAIALFVFQILLVMWGNLDHAVNQLKIIYLVRTGFDAGSNPADQEGRSDYIKTIWGHVEEGYGNVGGVLLILSVLFVFGLAIYLLRQKVVKKSIDSKIAAIAQLAFLAVAPGILQMAIFLNHSAVHSFSILKYSTAIAIVPFVLVPVFVAVIARRIFSGMTFQKAVMISLLPALLLSALYLTTNRNGYQAYFGDINVYWYALVSDITRNTNPVDIVFSPVAEIPYHPPQLLALSKKRVYRIEQLEEIKEKIANAKGDYQVVIMLEQKPSAGSYWYPAFLEADNTVQDKYFYLYLSPEKIKNLQI